MIKLWFNASSNQVLKSTELREIAMKHSRLHGIWISILMCSPLANATEIHKCEDQQGNVTFEKVCPPGSKSLSSKNYSGNQPQADDVEALPTLVFYSITKCDVCDDLRDFLSKQSINAMEKNIENDGALQQELKGKTGGDLRVPVLIIGEKVLPGYNEEQLRTELTQAGFNVADETSSEESAQ